MMGTILSLVGRGDEAHFDQAVEQARSVGAPTLVGANQTLQALGRLALNDIAGARTCLEVDTRGRRFDVESTALWLEVFDAVRLADGAARARGHCIRRRRGIVSGPGSRCGRSSA